MERLKKQFKPLLRFLRDYLKKYGGMDAVILSPFFIISAIISLISYSSWISGSWSNQSISIMPSLLGFTLGTYALLFSLISSRIKFALKSLNNSNETSYFDEMNSTFFHFILVQVISLIYAILYKQTLFYDIKILVSYYYPHEYDLFPYIKYAGGYLGCLLMIYAILSIISASLTVYRISRINDPAEGQ